MPRSFLQRQHQRDRRRSRDTGAINAHLSEARKSEFRHKDVSSTVLSDDRTDDFPTMEMGQDSKSSPEDGREETFANSGTNSGDSKSNEQSGAGNKTGSSDSQKRSENNDPGHLPSSPVKFSDVFTIENDDNFPRSAFTSSQVDPRQTSDAGSLSRQMAYATNLRYYETPSIAHPSQAYPRRPVPVVTLSSPTHPAAEELPLQSPRSYPNVPIADWSVDTFSASVNARQLYCKMLLSGYKVPLWPCAHVMHNISDCRPVTGFSTPMQLDRSYVRQRMKRRGNTPVWDTSKKSIRTLEEDSDCGNLRNKRHRRRSEISSGSECQEIHRFGRRIESAVSSVDKIYLNRFNEKRTFDSFSTAISSAEKKLLNTSRPFFAVNGSTSKMPSEISAYVETDFHVRPEIKTSKAKHLPTRITSEKKCLVFEPIYSDSQEQKLDFGSVLYYTLQDSISPARINQEQKLPLLPSMGCLKKWASSGTLVTSSDSVSCLSTTSQCHNIEKPLKSSTSKAFFPADTLTVSKSTEVCSNVKTDFSIVPETENLSIRKESDVSNSRLCKQLFLLPEKDSDNTIKLECNRNNSHTNASNSESIVSSVANAKSHNSQDVVQPRIPVQNKAWKSSILPVGRLYRPYLDCPRGFSDLETPRISLPVPGRGGSGQTKKYPCDLCGRAFSRTNTLVTHKRIHTGEKPFRCDICGREFRQPGNLTRHRFTHTSIKPYACAVCLKAFNRMANLHTHMRTHERRRTVTIS